MKKAVKLDAETNAPQATEVEDTVDKRPWLMDCLMEIGQDMAMMNHANEKLQYLRKDMENAESDEELDILMGKVNAYNDILDTIYESYNIKMTNLFENIEGAQKDARCLLKHAAYKVTLAMELRDARPSSVTAAHNLNLAFDIFAMAVSLAIGVEFSDCIRCLYDGIKDASEQAR